jgi:hypothetical protein
MQKGSRGYPESFFAGLDLMGEKKKKTRKAYLFFCQVASIRIFLHLPFENIYVLQRTAKSTYRPFF